MTEIKIGDKVRYTNDLNPDWLGQEGVVTDNRGLIEYRITKAVPDKQWGPVAKGMNMVGNTVCIHSDSLIVIKDEEPKFNVGDTVRFSHGPATHWIGQEGVVTESNKAVTLYKVTKPSANHHQFGCKEYNRVGTEVTISNDRLELVKAANTDPKAKFKVGDVVRLTEKGASGQGMSFLREGLQGTLTRVHWYSSSEEWGYKMEIPGITDIEDLRWVKEFEFYKDEFILESKLTDASKKRLKAAEVGTIVWDEDGDRWLKVSEENDEWKFINYDGELSTITESSKGIKWYGPISFIKP